MKLIHTSIKDLLGQQKTQTSLASFRASEENHVTVGDLSKNPGALVDETSLVLACPSQ
jgi:hypothetical protein